MQQEQELSCVNGWVTLAFLILLGVLMVFLPFHFMGGALMGVAVFAGSIACKGFFILQPNQAIIATFFGTYTGSHKEPGFFWMNPLNTARKISMKVSNYSTPHAISNVN